MWFGNLVTMEWWDNIWLNESFADLFSYIAMAGIEEKTPGHYDDVWLTHSIRKAWGYETEENHYNTHPIFGPVEDTLKADIVFDGISYSKGGAVVK